MKKETVEENMENKNISAAEDVLPKVGTTLKETRERKKLKLSDIAQALYIRKVYLEAIENNDYENIPEAPYGIGFIRTYAEYLGLNGNQMVQFFKNEARQGSVAEGRVYVADEQNEAGVPGKKYLLFSLLAVIAVYAGWTMFNQTEEEEPVSETLVVERETTESAPLVVEDYSFNNNQENDAAEGEAFQTAEPEVPVADRAQIVVTNESFEEKTEENPVAAAQPVEEKAVPAEEENKAPVAADKPDSRVVLKVKKETWVEVKDGSKLYLSKVLQPEAIYALPNEKGIILSVGKNDGVDVWVDGKLTEVVTPVKKMNIEIDRFLSANH